MSDRIEIHSIEYLFGAEVVAVEYDPRRVQGIHPAPGEEYSFPARIVIRGKDRNER